jgi:cobalt-zinc-cadmium efflux system outer membrane protein
MSLLIAAVVAGVMTLRAVTFAQVPAGPPAVASTGIDQDAGMTLEEAVAQALSREPSLRAAQTEIDALRGERIQADLRPNPSVSFSQQDEPGGSDNQSRIEVQWPLDLFRRSARVEVAERQIAAAQQGVAERERRLAGEVRLKYGEAAAVLRELQVTGDLLTATTRQLSLIAARVDAGGATALDRNLLRVEVQRLEADRLLQTGGAEAALIELKRLLGLPADAPLTLRSSLDLLVHTAAAPPQAGDAGAIASRPDVLEAEALVGVSDAQVDRARREGRPDVSVFGAYMRMDAGFPQRGFGDFGDLQRIHGVFHYVSAGAMVTIPLLNRNQGAAAAAEARRLGAAARLEAARLTAASEIASARARNDRAQQALATYASGARDLARENLDVVRQAYELGRVTLFDVLNEQRRYLDVERAYTAALREAFDARQALLQALGEVR